MLRVMSEEDPYSSPLHYDLEYRDKTEDIAWYVSLARSLGGPVLELGCGNGRITLEIARAGVEVHGIDNHPKMLQDLERKLRAAPEEVRLRVRYDRGDFLKLRGPARHPLVILPFNTIHHCHHHRDVLRLLSGVRSCLRPKGLFALDMYRPYPELYQRDPEERYCECDFTHPHTGAQIHSWEQSWYDPETQIHHVKYVYVNEDGTRHEVNLPLRVFYPKEFEALIDVGGFHVVAEYGDFHNGQVGPNSAKWVLVLLPRPARR